MASVILRRIVGQASFSRICRHHINHVGKRSILSSVHCCQDAWDMRKNAPLLKKINVGDLALRIQERLDIGDVKAVDMDILANKLDELESQQWSFVQNVFHRFRHTRETINASDSMSHAVIRALVRHDETDRLFEMLCDKKSYGIFLDDYSALFLLDHFIKNERWGEGAQVAFDVMLQEDFSHPLVRSLSMLTCLKYWKHLEASPVEPQAETSNQDDDEVWIPVNFIRNPWYDDHWDIRRDSLKLGKTLTMISRLEDGFLRDNISLLGMGLHEKFPEAINYFNNTVSNPEKSLAKDTVDTFLSILSNVETSEPPEEPIEPGSLTMADVEPHVTSEQKEKFMQEAQEVIAKLESNNQIVNESVEDEVVKKVKELSSILEPRDIETQKSIFKSWEEDRELVVKANVEAIKMQQRKRELAQKLLAIQEKEERMSYFEDKQKVMLGISRAPKSRPIEDVVEEEQFVLPPGERGRTT